MQTNKCGAYFWRHDSQVHTAICTLPDWQGGWSQVCLCRWRRSRSGNWFWATQSWTAHFWLHMDKKLNLQSHHFHPFSPFTAFETQDLHFFAYYQVAMHFFSHSNHIFCRKSFFYEYFKFCLLKLRKSSIRQQNIHLKSLKKTETTWKNSKIKTLVNQKQKSAVIIAQARWRGWCTLWFRMAYPSLCRSPLSHSAETRRNSLQRTAAHCPGRSVRNDN